jgi:hypothetical protein
LWKTKKVLIYHFSIDKSYDSTNAVVTTPVDTVVAIGTEAVQNINDKTIGN